MVASSNVTAEKIKTPLNKRLLVRKCVRSDNVGGIYMTDNYIENTTLCEVLAVAPDCVDFDQSHVSTDERQVFVNVPLQEGDLANWLTRVPTDDKDEELFFVDENQLGGFYIEG